MNAKKNTVTAVLLVTAIGVMTASAALAGQQSITLPKGTKANGLAAGHVGFVLPNGGKAEVRGLEIKAGVFTAIEVRDVKGKLVRSGKAGRLVRSRTLTREEAVKLPPTDYIKIDDDVTWLPLLLQFEGLVGLSPQPDPPGKAPKP